MCVCVRVSPNRILPREILKREEEYIPVSVSPSSGSTVWTVKLVDKTVLVEGSRKEVSFLTKRSGDN